MGQLEVVLPDGTTIDFPQSTNVGFVNVQTQQLFGADTSYSQLYLSKNKLASTQTITVKWSSVMWWIGVKVEKISINYMSHIDNRSEYN